MIIYACCVYLYVPWHVLHAIYLYTRSEISVGVYELYTASNGFNRVRSVAAISTGQPRSRRHWQTWRRSPVLLAAACAQRGTAEPDWSSRPLSEHRRRG